MNPALSVIFFTTLSGAGYGLFIWLGVLLLLRPLTGRLEDASPMFLTFSLCVASALVAVGLLSSMLHLGKPGRAWRAFSQWRTSWLSREGVMCLVTYVPVAVLLVTSVLAVPHTESSAAPRTAWLRGTAAAMTACAFATIVCTAMIYSSLKTIPAWRQRLVVPAYLAFALLSGGALLAAMRAFAGVSDSSVHAFAASIAVLAFVTGSIKLAYWQALDAQTLPGTRGEAVGLPGREVGVFERPHTEESYITREMAFFVARKHARRLRSMAMLLFCGVPILAAAAAWWRVEIAGVAFVAAALGAFAGAFVERWLFFAEARHVVTLYY